MQQQTPLITHLIELRSRLIKSLLAVVVGFAICYAFKEPIFQFLTQPLRAAQGGQLHMVFTALPEMFITYLKVAFFGGLFIGLPFMLWQIWRFIAPGLYDHESIVVLPFLIATPLMFYVGGAFSFFVLMPVAVPFFFGFAGDGLMALPSVKEYLNFIIKMTLAFGLAFELPVLIVILARAGLVKIEQLTWFRRYAIVALFVVAAVLTPPDPISQLMLAIPLVILYEVGIIAAKMPNRKKEASEKAAKKTA